MRNMPNQIKLSHKTDISHSILEVGCSSESREKANEISRVQVERATDSDLFVLNFVYKIKNIYYVYIIISNDVTSLLFQVPLIYKIDIKVVRILSIYPSIHPSIHPVHSYFSR